MSNLTDRANYLKGLADGLQLNTEKSSNRLLLELIDLAAATAAALEELEKNHAELSDYVEAIDEDLSDVEEMVTDALDEPVFPEDEEEESDEEAEADVEPQAEDEPTENEDEAAPAQEPDESHVSLKKKDAEHEDGEDIVYYNCPHCAKEVSLKVNSLDLDEDMPCPFCGKPLFPENDDD